MNDDGLQRLERMRRRLLDEIGRWPDRSSEGRVTRMYRHIFECTLAAAVVATPFPVLAQTRVGTAIPTRVGTCAFTRVTGVHQRLVGENGRGIPDS